MTIKIKDDNFQELCVNIANSVGVTLSDEYAMLINDNNNIADVYAITRNKEGQSVFLSEDEGAVFNSRVISASEYNFIFDEILHLYNDTNEEGEINNVLTSGSWTLAIKTQDCALSLVSDYESIQSKSCNRRLAIIRDLMNML